jgi:peptide/nickel transport system permease protein
MTIRLDEGTRGGGAVPHVVSREPFDPYAVEAMTPRQERYYQASQWQLMW